MELRRRDAIFSSIGGSAFTKSVRPSSLASLVICACAPGANSNDAPKTATQNTVTTISKLAGLDLRFPIDFYCGRQFYEPLHGLPWGRRSGFRVCTYKPRVNLGTICSGHLCVAILVQQVANGRLSRVAGRPLSGAALACSARRTA